MRVKKERLGKAALARQQTSSTDVAAEFEQDRAKFNSIIQDYGIIFNTDNTTKSNDVVDKVDALVALFGMTFSRISDRLVLNTEAYTTHTHTVSDITDFDHTHAFNDATIADTADGTGTQTDTVRETEGVS